MKTSSEAKHNEATTDTICYHCGQVCAETLWLEDKPFCCYGCKTVYEIISSNEMCAYYAIDSTPGAQQKEFNSAAFAYLDEATLYKKIIEFDSPSFAKVRFFIPLMHCASCIWLLENLRRFDHGIQKSEVNFSKKSVVIDFNPQQIKLSKVADILQSIGYPPQISLEGEPKKSKSDNSLIIKLTIAGFCFGNVMLFSFPEYLGFDHSDETLGRLFSWLNLALAFPVFVYSASGYFVSALKSFKQKQINIDVPIAAGLLALFLRSSYDIITATGAGYLDSFTGLVFFLLIGRWFQSKTYESMAFDRDFKSYFPLAVNKLVHNEWKPCVIYQIEKGDTIKIRNMEIVPADSVLQDAQAYIDYSFVTGESKPVRVTKGEQIYAGGRLIGQPITLTVEKKTSQSHLTSLWNHDIFRKRHESNYQRFIDSAARKFTWVVMGVAFITAVYWYYVNPSHMWLVLTSVLMVACPCALALAAPFTYGSMLRAFGKHQFYLKNADVIERMAMIDAVVFDKTGTITYTKEPTITFSGELSQQELSWIKTLTSYSTHPLSSLITKSIHESSKANVEEFKELSGKGIEARIQNHHIKIGSALFTGFHQQIQATASHVFISIDDEVRGYFSICISIRNNIKEMLARLGSRCMALLSGDHDTDKTQMQALFGPHVQLFFNQSPHDKLDYIFYAQQYGRKVMMLGDGLNDAGALKQSDVGIAVTDDTGVFTPACDGILQGNRLNQLDKFISLARTSSTILKIAFAISFMYNAIALSFAVTGHLTPLVAAILMPISSISVVAFSSLSVGWIAKRKLRIMK